MIESTIEIKNYEKGQRICRSRGGESCAFDGALIVLQPIADAVHLIHGPISCSANSWQGRGTISERGLFHKMGFTTDLSEIDLILGADNKLIKALESVSKRFSPQAIYVYSTCVTGLLGEDIERVCALAREKLGIDVIPVNAPGFVGPKNLGNRIAGEVLLEHVIGKEEPPFVTERDINIIGEYNIAGDQFLIEPLLEEAGLRILSRITGNSTYKEIKWAHRAKLNVLICSRALINIGIEMKKRYGIPFVEVSFFGKTETSNALREIARAFNDLSLKDRVENLIKREELNLELKLKEYEILNGKRAVLYTGGVKSWSMISALKDLGIEVVAVGTKKSTYEDEAKIRELVSDNCFLFEDTSAKNILRVIEEKNAQILIAGGRNLYLAIKEGIPFVDVNQERHRAYAGYRGLINLAEDINKAISFYDKRKTSIPLIKIHKKEVTVDPLKNSSFVGAIVALQGIDKAMPVLHSPQGCNFLGKVLLIKHFREPIAMISTKLFTEEVVMGGEEKLRKTLDELKNGKVSLVALVTGALSHMRGESIDHILEQYNEEDFRVIHIKIPDYEGGFEWGYERALMEIIKIIPNDKINRRKGQVNIISGGHFTPADFTELKKVFKLFGLGSILLPDLSSLEGARRFSAITEGGTKLEDIFEMKNSEFTFILGNSLESIGKELKRRFGIEYKVFESLYGLKAFDEFLETLSLLSERDIPQELLRERRILIDAMRDVQFYVSGKKIAIALEPDHALGLSKLIGEMDMSLQLAIVPEKTEYLNKIEAKEVLIGDLSALSGEYNLIISNSHAEERARKMGIPLYEMGFPVYKTIGYPQKVTVGYRGSLNILNDIANVFLREAH
ncbi:MAG: nitrogenase iron-molybdenum cofactor biosynthesis protein NifE [Syntrophobacterales bacterium]|nr:nitrogenase iron-molybdenum cofactor biosynthesis protein NifE [Syntrophobacterales bacterium]